MHGCRGGPGMRPGYGHRPYTRTSRARYRGGTEIWACCPPRTTRRAPRAFRSASCRLGREPYTGSDGKGRDLTRRLQGRAIGVTPRNTRVVAPKISIGRGSRPCKNSSSLQASGCRALACKATVESVPPLCHVDQEPCGDKTRAMRSLQPFAEFDERLGSHHVDIGERTAGERGEAEAKDRA